MAREHARPDERWLPVLGYVTGCRVAELVYLQGRDLKWHKEARAWTFDLHDKILIGRKEVQRPLKTPGSRRIIALPHFLHEVGFIDWARERPGFIFDLLHRTKTPPGAASKRMMKMLRACGIDSEGEVFHSLRHSHKDWLRDLKIAERTIDLQSGHALEGVAKKYGAKSLRPEEIRELSLCELPPKLRELIEPKKRRKQ
jgi:integrase